VIGSTTVADLDLSPAGLSSTSGTELRTKTGARISANWILAEETFLSDVLFAIPPSSDAKSLGDGKYALPLTPAFFQYFSVDEVGTPLVSVQEAPLAVTVSLRLPLQSGGTLDVERTYRDTEIVLPPEGAGVPALTVWPGFTDPDWSRNIAIYASIVPSRRGRTDREIQVAPFFSDGSAAQSERSTTTKPILVWSLRRPPLGFSFQTVDPQTRRRLSAGVIVRSDTDAPPQIRSNLRWQVAVDFGTSNTEIMLKAGERDQKPKPLSLRNRSRLLTQASEATLPLLRNVTSPEHTVRPPIPTVLKYASQAFSGDPSADISGAEAYVVVNELADDLSLRYKADFEPFLATIAAAPDRFVTDVKWGRGNDEDAPLRAYLQALAQLIACEARAAGAGNLEFRWSYPLSLPRRARAAMGNFWSSVRSSLSLSGMEVTASDGLSESEALARCMANSSDILPVRAESLSIAIDIGGGSTDIGFWSRMTLLDRVSIRIAGNDIVRLADPNLADFAYRAANGVPIDRVTAQTFVTRPELAWNMMLRQAEENSQGYNPREPQKHPFLVAMGTQSGNAQWIHCRSAAFLVFAGITYYVGLHARKYATPVKDIAIYFGGRGSSILTWIAPERALRDSFTRAFQQGIGAGLQEGDTIPSVSFYGPAFSPVAGSLSLKEEVARGLLEPSESSLSIAVSDKDTTIVGEMLWTNHDGVVKQWDDVVTVEQLGDLRPPPNHNSGYLAYLLARVISPAIEELNLDPLLDHVSIQSSWLQHNIGIAAEDRVLQPVFAFELRGLLDAYVKTYRA